VLHKNSEIIREQLLLKIEESFLSAVNTGRIAKLSHDELVNILEFLLEEKRYE
jgi:GntR family transcriptional regulator